MIALLRALHRRLAQLRLRLAERALAGPWTTAASAAIDRAIVALERLEDEGRGGR